MFLVGLTGGIATGKSTVCSTLTSLGIPVLDADLIARQVVEPGKPAWKQIRETFGAEVIDANGLIDRARLGEIIFGDEEKRKQLNKICHPKIYKEMFLQCVKLMFSGYQFAVLDLPLLFESGYMVPFMSKIIVVKCNEEQQLHRLMSRNNLSEDEAKSRIDAQLSLEEKCRRAQFVLDNSGSIESTKRQTEATVASIRQSWAQWIPRLAIVSILLGTFSLLKYLSGLLF